MNRKGILGCAAALALATLGGNAFAAAGGFSANGVIGTTYSSNLWNTTNLSTLSTAPADGKINSISWSYTIGSIPANATFTAYLCQDNTSSCINVTSFRSGSTQAFNGRSANGRFFIYHQIYRSTSFAPVSGGSAQVIVNWDNN